MPCLQSAVMSPARLSSLSVIVVIAGCDLTFSPGIGPDADAGSSALPQPPSASSGANGANGDGGPAAGAAPSNDDAGKLDASADAESGGGPAGGSGAQGDGQGKGTVPFFDTFAIDQNPIASPWVHRGSAWQFIRARGGNAVPTVWAAGGAESGPPFDDCYAHVTGFPADQQVEVTLYRGAATGGEAEILLRVNDTSTSVQAYELLYNVAGGAEIVRWNGPLNDYEENPTGTTIVNGGPPAAITGDKLRGRIVGTFIQFWFIPSTGSRAGVPQLLATLDDQSSRRITSGQPGIAFFQRNPGSLDYGFADFTATTP